MIRIISGALANPLFESGKMEQIAGSPDLTEKSGSYSQNDFSRKDADKIRIWSSVNITNLITMALFGISS